MLLRMYVRWVESLHKVETMDFLAGDEANQKRYTAHIRPKCLWIFKVGERCSSLSTDFSFDASGRRHTSFAAIDVMPEIDDNVEIDINMNDVRVDTFRAGGAGGQHINKTDSAVRMTKLHRNDRSMSVNVLRLKSRTVYEDV